MKRRLFYLDTPLSAGIILGVAAGSFSWPFSIFIIGCGFVSFWFFYFFGFFRGLISIIVLLSVSLSSLSYYQYYQKRHDFVLVWEKYYGQEVDIEGTVADDPDPDFPLVRLRIGDVCLYSSGRQCWPMAGKVEVVTMSYFGYHQGDRLSISGKVQAIPVFDNFRYDLYLARYGVFSQIYLPDITLIYSHRGFLSLIREEARAIITRELPEPEAGLAVALVLGYKNSLSQKIEEDFSVSGLSHLIAISGSHIAIIFSMLSLVFFTLRAGKKWSSLLSLSLAGLYVAMSGFQPSAVRSVIMAALILLGKDFLRCWLAAGAVMLAFNPLLLRDDIGFQLSFLSVAGIAFIFPHLSRLYQRVSAGWLKLSFDGAAMTISSLAFSWPVLLSAFSRVPVIGVLSNMVVGPLFCLILPMGILAVIISAVWPLIGRMIFFILYGMLKAAIMAAAFFALW